MQGIGFTQTFNRIGCSFGNVRTGIFYSCRFHVFTDDRGVACRQVGTRVGIRFAVRTFDGGSFAGRNDVIAFHYENAIAFALVFTAVSSIDSLLECSVPGYDKVIQSFLYYRFVFCGKVDDDGLCQRIVGEILYTVCRQCKGISRRVGEPFIFEYYGFSRYRWNKFCCSDSAFGIFGHFHFLVKCQNDLSVGRSSLESFGGNCTDQFGRSTIVNQFCSSRDISCSNAGTVVIGRSSVYF